MKKDNNTGTFIVKIMNQQRSTWQGSVVWVEEQETKHFRSTHELIKMIDEAIGANQDSEEEQA